MIRDKTDEVGTDTDRQELKAGSRNTSRSGTRLGRGRWTLFALAIAVFFSMGHFAGAYQKEKEQQELKAKTITSERFEVRGPDDKLKASLYKGRGGEVYLVFFDDAGNARLNLGLNDKGSPVISWFDAQPAQRMSLSLDSEDGTPQVILYDGKNTPAVHMGVVQGFGPHLTIGKDGDSQITAFLTADGSPSFQILNEKRKAQLALSISNKEPTIAMMGENGFPRALWRVQADGSVSLAFAGSEGPHRLVIATDKEGRPSIRFIDANNKVVREFN